MPADWPGYRLYEWACLRAHVSQAEASAVIQRVNGPSAGPRVHAVKVSPDHNFLVYWVRGSICFKSKVAAKVHASFPVSRI